MDSLQKKKEKLENTKEKKKRFVLTGIVILIGIIILVWIWLSFFSGYFSVDDAYIDRDKATISSKILGRISKILVDEGDIIRKGEILVQLDNAELLAQKKIAEESVVLSKINLEKAADDYRRYSTIYKSNNLSYEDYIKYKNAYETAEKQVDVALAQRDLSYANISNTTITANFNGIVSKKWLLDGEVVQPGQAILSVNDIDTLWAIANVEETRISSVHINDDVQITIDAYPGVKFRGKVVQIGANTASQFSLIPADNASGNFTKVTQRVPVKMTVFPVNPEDRLSKFSFRPGMSILVKFRKR